MSSVGSIEIIIVIKLGRCMYVLLPLKAQKQLHVRFTVAQKQLHVPVKLKKVLVLGNIILLRALV